MVQCLQNHSKRQITVFFLLSSFLLICFQVMFPCKNCQEGFSALSAKGLKQHQNKCQDYLNHEAIANERRKATVASKNIRRTKLKERKERLGSTVAAPGKGVSLAIFNNSHLIGLELSVRKKLALLDQVQVLVVSKMKTMFPRTWGTWQWIKTCQVFLLQFHQPLHLRCLPLLNLQNRVGQSGIIACLLVTKTLILNFCHSLTQRKPQNQLQQLYCRVCASLCAIICRLLQILLVYSENTFTDLPLILTLSFLQRTSIKLEELMESCNHHIPPLLFTKTSQLKCL